VLVAESLEPVASALRRELGLGEPYRDPGVGAFGLENAVFALGDCFIEVVSPVREGTAAGRHLERLGGDGGYMVMFDLEDIAAARAGADTLGIRKVWEIDLDDISGTHLHPSDIGGAIVSVDSSRPYGTWRWGGPAWTGTVGTGAPGRLRGVSLAVAEPREVAGRWAGVLSAPATSADGTATLELEGACVRFQSHPGPREPGLVEVAVAVPESVRAGREAVTVGGVRFALFADG
jgi:Glyoxalase-like domain